MDLLDAYLHVPMHQAIREFLRFTIDGQVYQFRAFPFRLNLAPLIFTKMMSAVMSYVRMNSCSMIVGYLDDILQKSQFPQSLQQDSEFSSAVSQEFGLDSQSQEGRLDSFTDVIGR